MPLGQGHRMRSLYDRALAAHIAGSLVSGLLAGGALGSIGGWVGLAPPDRSVWLGMGGLSLVLALREFGWLRFPVPQWPRQTQKLWGNRFGPVAAAWWWGLDLGSGLTTLVTFSGYWLLVLATFLRGSAGYGALVLGLFGLGRALAVSIAPQLFDRHRLLRDTMHDLLREGHQLRRWHGFGLVVLTGGWLLHGMLLG